MPTTKDMEQLQSCVVPKARTYLKTDISALAHMARTMATEACATLQKHRACTEASKADAHTPLQACEAHAKLSKVTTHTPLQAREAPAKLSKVVAQVPL